ncbi:MAG TPA: galactokinase [Firmicutes bacterium]|nr:galactokinase [Bacillota bacterium]
MNTICERLTQRFTQIYEGKKPTAYITVPGRVNLIGEHTDYNGLPVMPMAIARGIRIVLAPRGDALVHVTNAKAEFGTREFAVSKNIPPYVTGDWGNYIKSGAQGVIEAYASSQNGMLGFDALIDSDLPMAAGLSSSSALVVASALALMAANGIPLERTSLAEQMAAAERYVGTMGGGMDQAVILLAQADSALKIDFYPLRTQSVTLPEGYSVVICNSLVVAPKTEAARLNYNRRPLECHLATALLAHHMSTTGGSAVQAERMADLLRYKNVRRLLALAADYLGEGPWTREKAAAELNMTISQLEQRFFLMRDGQILPEYPEGMPLLQRVRHVLTEGERVEASLTALAAGDAHAFGRLMHESHASCRDLYGISCPELEQLVDAARKAGAVGARLTGAGFGGCTVNLVANDKVAEFKEQVVKVYYEGYLHTHKPALYQTFAENDPESMVIVSTPADGAVINQLS